MLFALMLFLLLTASINYALSLGFVLTFLMAGLYLVSIYHAFANLADLRLEPGKAKPVFAGESARFKINVEGGGRSRPGIGFLAGGRESFCNVENGKESVVEFILEAKRRGWFHPGRFTVFTRHPLGLFRAWSYVELFMPCLVYPAPFHAASRQHEGLMRGEGRPVAGCDDFSGLRAYRPGDSIGHVAWKSVAMGRGMQVKEFEELKGNDSLWLDWEGIDGDAEARLSKLAGMTLDAYGRGRHFGLRLPNKIIPVGMGELQKLRVLEALALFEP